MNRGRFSTVNIAGLINRASKLPPVQYRTTDHVRFVCGPIEQLSPDVSARDSWVKLTASQLLSRHYNQINTMNFQESGQSAVCDTGLPDDENRDLALPPKSGVLGTREPDFEEIVDGYYRPLYQFALSLTHSDADASDLTQQTFFTWSTKGGQLRNPSKVRSWLFTTLHRAFLQTKRHQTRFPHYELDEVDRELPELPPLVDSRLDAFQALNALQQIDEVFRAPVALFYLEDCPYQEIADILDVPLGTVKSRIARGIARLQRALTPAHPMFQGVAA